MCRIWLCYQNPYADIRHCSPPPPAMLEIWGLPHPPIPPATASAALRGLGIALIIPGEQAFAAAPGWSDTFHQWDRFIPVNRAAGTPPPRL